MIPSNLDLFSRLNRDQIQKILLSPHNYFTLVEEYINLQKVFEPQNLLETASLWFDMLVSPVMIIVQSIMNRTIQILSILSFQKCINLWKDWLRWRELQTVLREWVKIIRAIGGPFISTNDANYHMYVYADAMQRIYEGLLTTLITKKCTKRF